MKRIVPFVLLALVCLSLAGCSRAASKGGDALPTPAYAPVEYSILTSRCEADTLTSSMVCTSPGGDLTLLDGLLSSYSAQGWELVSALPYGPLEDHLYAFIFKRLPAR